MIRQNHEHVKNEWLETSLLRDLNYKPGACSCSLVVIFLQARRREIINRGEPQQVSPYRFISDLGRAPGLGLGGRFAPLVAAMDLFSRGSQLSRSGKTLHCGQICNWNFHKDQQRSTTTKMQPPDFE